MRDIRVKEHNESGGYDDPGGHRFAVHGLYRRCTVLKTALDMVVEILKMSRGARRRKEKRLREGMWPRRSPVGLPTGSLIEARGTAVERGRASGALLANARCER